MLLADTSLSPGDTITLCAFFLFLFSVLVVGAWLHTTGEQRELEREKLRKTQIDLEDLRLLLRQHQELLEQYQQWIDDQQED